MNLNFRKMLPEDAAAVEIVEKSCFAVPWSRQAFWEEASNDKTYYLLALDDTKVIGGFYSVKRRLQMSLYCLSIAIAA